MGMVQNQWVSRIQTFPPFNFVHGVIDSFGLNDFSDAWWSSWRWVIQTPKIGWATNFQHGAYTEDDPTAYSTQGALCEELFLGLGAHHAWSRSWIRDMAQSARFFVVSFTCFKKSPLDPKGWFTHIFRSSKSPPNLWVFLFLAFFLVVIRSRSFPEGAVESTYTSNTSSCPAFGTWFRTASLCVCLWKTYESSKGTRLPSSVIAHTFKYKDAPSEEDISYSTTQCINSSLGQS